LKILRIAGEIYPDIIGGIALHTHHMSKIQSQIGHEVTVITSDYGNKDLPRKEKRNGYELIRFEEIMKPVDNSICPGIGKYLLEHGNEYDIIHTHSHLFFSSNLATKIGNILKKPVVLTNHGFTSQTAPRALQSIYNSTIGKWTFNLADLVFCYTDQAKQELRENGIQTDIEVIHNGINCEFFKPNTDIEKKSQLLYVGRLKPLKGIEYLIEAFDIITDDYPDLHLKLVGEGPLKDDLKDMVEDLGIQDNVIFEGEVEYEDMPDYYNESLLFVSPTLTEAAVPRVAMEAWACELPVVISDIPQTRGKIKRAGFTFEPKSPEDLSKKVLKLLDDGELRELLGQKARKRVKEKFSWQETVEKTTEAYNEIL